MYASLYINIYMHTDFIHSYAYLGPRATPPTPAPSRKEWHADFPTQLPAAGAGLGAAGYRLCLAEPAGLAAGVVHGCPCAVARRPLPGHRGTAAPGKGAGAAGALRGGASWLRAGEPGSQPFLKGSVSSDVQPRALVAEGPPAQLALFIYVANKIRGEPNAR